jgi:hypothetical protein
MPFSGPDYGYIWSEQKDCIQYLPVAVSIQYLRLQETNHNIEQHMKILIHYIVWDSLYLSRLRNYATSRMVADLIPDEVAGFF